MANRLYIVPAFTIVDASEPQGARYPKYFRDHTATTNPPAVFFQYAAMDYGYNPTFLVKADLAPADHAALVANSDVFSFPEDLNTLVGAGQLQAVKDALEVFLIPSQTVAGSDTYRSVARMIAGMCQIMQRINGTLGNQIFLTDTTRLNTQWNSVPLNIRTAVLDAATSLGYDVSFIQNNTQVRAIMKNFADQWGNKPFDLGGFIF